MKLLTKGRTSEIYELDKGRLLKLYNGWAFEDLLTHEFEATNAAFDAGIPCARAHEVIEKEYRKGIVFEFIHGRQLKQHMIFQPWNIGRYGARMARLHAQVHSIPGHGLRPQKALMESAIEASYSILKPYWNKVMDCTAQLSDSPARLCHGDFSVENILVTPGLVLTDWGDACSGNPAGDVARAWILIHTPYRNAELPPWAGAAKRWLWHSYLKAYMAITGVSEAECMAWRMPMAAARLKEFVPGEREWLLRMIK